MTTTAPDHSPRTGSPVPGGAGPAGTDGLLAAAARAAAVLAAGADRHDREGSYAPENIVAIWEAGLGNLSLPVDAGGPGADLVAVVRVVEILAAADPSSALIYVMHLVHLRTVTAPGGAWPPALRDRIVAESLAGPALINALRVEPELGTPARGGLPATRARRVTGRDGAPAWRLNGRKIYSTGSHGLRWMNVWAATEVDGPDGPQTGYFVVPADADGVEIVDTWDHLGMRASASNDVVLHDVEIPIGHGVGLAGPGQVRDPGARVALSWGTVLILAVYQGTLLAGRDWLVGYLNERVPTNLGAPLATLPRFQSAIGEIEALVHTNDRLLHGVAADLDAGGTRAEAALAGVGLTKVVVTANVIRGLESGLALIGNPGLSHHHPLQRHYRNALCSRIHTPQDDVVLTAAGRAALRL